MGTSLSVVVPVHNEDKTLAQTVWEAARVAQCIAEDYEIIIVDDGSTDGTAGLAAQLAMDIAAVQVITHSTNLDKGAALRSGFLAASKELVFYTDADLAVDLNVLSQAVESLGDADLLAGYPHTRKHGLRRYVFSKVYNWLIRVLFDVRIRDVNFCFKLIKKPILVQLSLDAETVFIDGQLLAEARRRGFTVKEMEVKYFPRKEGRSHFGRVSYAFRTLREMMSYWRRSRGRGPVTSGNRPRSA